MYRHRHVGLPTKGTPCTIRAAFRHWSSSAKYASSFSRVFCKAEYTRWLYSNTIIIKIHQPDELQQYSYITHAVTSATVLYPVNILPVEAPLLVVYRDPCHQIRSQWIQPSTGRFFYMYALQQWMDAGASKHVGPSHTGRYR